MKRGIMNIKKYEKAYAEAQAGGMSNDASHEFATDQATRETKAEREWTLLPENDTYDEQGISPIRARSVVQDKTVVAIVNIYYTDAETRDRCEANARLITSAPALLAEKTALLEALKVCADWLSRSARTDDQEIAQDARAAIAMAGGDK